MIKFNQSKALNSSEAIWAVGLDLGRYTQAQQGVCAALTLYYIKDVLAAQPIIGPLLRLDRDEMTRFERSKGISSINPHNRQIAASAISLQERSRHSDFFSNLSFLAFEQGIRLDEQDITKFSTTFLNNFQNKIIINQDKTIF